MNVDTIIDQGKLFANVTDAQVDDTIALRYLNFAYQDMIAAIVQEVNENFFYEVFTADTVANQSEYTMPVPDATTEGLKKVLSVSVKYLSTDSEFKKLVPTDIGVQSRDLDYYKTDQFLGEPIFMVADTSIFVYPSPVEAVTGGIKLYSSITPKDLVVGGAESTVLIPREFHEVLSEGMVPYIKQQRGLLNDKNDAINDYEIRKARMITLLSDRISEPGDMSLPSFSLIEY